ncbi:unnamed protein product [Ilex paraguariensis]|uniref:Aluminum-activated malate transporter n=1 Tax=Ilex paraguariensis TaxID=185542 RepID=A0ABC8QZD1_9AQUA
MEIAQRNEQTDGADQVSRARCWFKGLAEKLMLKVLEIASKTKKLGQEDPRRIIHSVKVGLAITSVSLFYYFDATYNGFGVSAMWAVMTVVVVFEFSVGATLGKGINRGIATLLAGALGVGAYRVATSFGEKIEPILLGFFVFLFGAVVTFVRFFPRMKARYDYGLLIFILTFSLISVSAYRTDEVIQMAHQRLSTILIGGAAAIITSVAICPVWAGDDFHSLVASNLEKVATFLKEFGSQYLKASSAELVVNKEFPQGYKSVINSKATEESLANFAKWEPRHGMFRYRHPWEKYLEVGNLTRQCAFRIDALNGYLTSEIQVPQEIGAKIQEICKKMTSETSLALKEVALGMRTMTMPSSSADSHIENARMEAKHLKSLLKTRSWPDSTDLLDIVPVAAVASLLIDIVACTEKIADTVKELAPLAHFKAAVVTAGQQKQLTRQQTHGREETHHIITMGESSPE